MKLLSCKYFTWGIDTFLSKKLRVFGQAVKFMKLEIQIKISLPNEFESARKLCKKIE